MAYKDNQYVVEAFDMQNKRASKETYNTRTAAEIRGGFCRKEEKTKLVKINGRVWRKKNKK